MLTGGDKGFTLIELLVVIAVLGILAGIAIPRLTGVRDEAEKSALLSTGSTIRNSMEMFYAVEGSYPSGTAISSVENLKTALDSGTKSDIGFDLSDTDVSISSTGTTESTGNGYAIHLDSSSGDYTIKIDNVDGVTTVSGF